jgi:hypothetical protein
MSDICDRCHTPIVSEECNCPYRLKVKEQPFLKMLESAMMGYDHLCEQQGNDFPLTGEHPSGNCIALFKGDSEMIEKVATYIEKLTEEAKDG